MNEPKNKWLFYIVTEAEKVAFLTEEGKPVLPAQASCFIGTEEESITEGDRRADLWDVANAETMSKKIIRQ